MDGQTDGQTDTAQVHVLSCASQLKILGKKLFNLNSLIPEGRTLGLAQSAEVPGLLPGQLRHVALDLGRGHQQDVALIRIGVIILHIVVSDV